MMHSAVESNRECPWVLATNTSPLCDLLCLQMCTDRQEHALNWVNGLIEFESLLERIKWKIKYNKNKHNSIKVCCSITDIYANSYVTNKRGLVYDIFDGGREL